MPKRKVKLEKKFEKKDIEALVETVALKGSLKGVAKDLDLSYAVVLGYLPELTKLANQPNMWKNLFADRLTASVSRVKEPYYKTETEMLSIPQRYYKSDLRVQSFEGLYLKLLQRQDAFPLNIFIVHVVERKEEKGRSCFVEKRYRSFREMTEASSEFNHVKNTYVRFQQPSDFKNNFKPCEVKVSLKVFDKETGFKTILDHILFVENYAVKADTYQVNTVPMWIEGYWQNDSYHILEISPETTKKSIINRYSSVDLKDWKIKY